MPTIGDGNIASASDLLNEHNGDGTHKSLSAYASGSVFSACHNVTTGAHAVTLTAEHNADGTHKFIAASYTTASAQAIANVTPVIINYGAKVYDTHNAVTTGSGWRFTAPSTMYYFVTAAMLYVSASWAAGTICSLILYKNGISDLQLARNDELAAGVAAIYRRVAGTVILALSAGEYFEIRAYHSAGSSQNLYTSSAFNYVMIQAINNSP